MAKAAGRNMLLKKAGTVIGGVRVTGLKMGATPIDVTDKDSAGIVELLSGAEESIQLTLTVSGVEKDAVLRGVALSTTAGAKLVTDLTLTFASALAAADILAGNFFMTEYSEDGDYKDAVMFSATFVSSGTWTLS
jgi:predicted secreted protein